MPAEKHWSWEFYYSDPQNKKYAKCKSCETTYTNGSTARMQDHLKRCKKATIATRQRVQDLIRRETVKANSKSKTITPAPSTSRLAATSTASTSAVLRESSATTSNKGPLDFHLDFIDKQTQDEVDARLTRVS